MNDTPVIDGKKTRPWGHAAAGADAAAVEELRREFGSRWNIARVTKGYRAIPRETGGRTAKPRYGSTPAELATSIRSVDRRR
jgi:uncharacterized protein with von Willebrand factor type A (vWA) domain